MKDKMSVCHVCGKECRTEETLITRDEKTMCIDCAIKYVIKNGKGKTITLEVSANK
jgi:NMD protein affecting ribosome stability and mRNA decay